MIALLVVGLAIGTVGYFLSYAIMMAFPKTIPVFLVVIVLLVISCFKN